MKISRKIIIMLTVVFLLSACSNSQQTEDSNQKTSIKVEKKLLSKEVTVPKNFLDLIGVTDPQEYINTLVAEKRIKSGKINDYGSVTYSMSPKQHKEFMQYIKDGIVESNQELINDPSTSVTDVKFNDSLSVFDVYVDPNSYSEFESILALGFYVQGGLYRTFNGDSETNIIVNFINKDTNEILNTADSKDIGNLDD